MSKSIDYKPIIEEVLRTYKPARSNDFTLQRFVYSEILKRKHAKGGLKQMTAFDFIHMQESKLLPCADTITRLSRDIKRNNPELQPADYGERKKKAFAIKMDVRQTGTVKESLIR